MSRGHFSSGIAESQHYLAAVGANKVARVLPHNWIARRLDVKMNVKAHVTDFIDEYIFPPEDGEEMTLESDNNADIGQIAFVNGLDENKLLKTGFYSLNGLTAVPIGKWSRINEVIMAVGNTLGLVTVEGGSNVYAQATAADGRSYTGVYSSPVDYRMQLLSWHVSMTCADTGADVRVCGDFLVRIANAVPSAWLSAFPFGLRTRGDSESFVYNTIPRAINGSIDTIIQAEASGNGAQLDVRTAIVLEELTPLEKKNLIGGPIDEVAAISGRSSF